MSGSRKGGRKAAAEANGRVTLTLHPAVIKRLESLAELGTFGGSTKPDVINYFITRMLDDLSRPTVPK
jgi:hypothetical protein